MLFGTAYVHQDPATSPTALSRLDLLHSLADGRLAIDKYHANTPDKAEWLGHFYSDKAPGTVALALPAFIAGRLALQSAGRGLNSDAGWVASSWVACSGSAGVIAALGAGCLFAWLAARVPPRCALATTLTLFLGAAPLPYATMMLSHAITVGLIAVALWAIGSSPACAASHGAPSKPRPAGLATRPMGTVTTLDRFDLLAGFCCGWALACEFTCGIVVVALLLWLWAGGWRRALAFSLAAAAPVLLIPAYSWACFGHPLTLPYSLNHSFPQMRSGLFSVRWPDLPTAYNLLVSPMRGLFFWTPFLLMAGAGYKEMARTNDRLFWLTYGVPILHATVMSGRTWDWPAGPSLGPRYLAPILPLLALPCAMGLARFPLTGLLLGAYSILITTAATLTTACPPSSVPNPLLDLQLPLLLEGRIAPTLGEAAGLPPLLSVLFYYAVLATGTAWLWRALPPGTALGKAPTAGDWGGEPGPGTLPAGA